MQSLRQAFPFCSVQQVQRAKRLLVHQLDKEMAFERPVGVTPLPDFQHLGGWQLTSLDQQQRLASRVGDYQVAVYFRAMQPHLLDVETIRQERRNRQSQIDQEKEHRDRMDEPLDDLEEEEENMKQSYNLTVSLQKDEMHLIYECASIDHHLRILHVLFPRDAEEYLQMAPFERLEKQDYPGPDMNLLDEDLQMAMGMQLQSLGIDEDLLSLVEQLGRHQEEEEYRQWLSHLSAYLQ